MPIIDLFSSPKTLRYTAKDTDIDGLRILNYTLLDLQYVYVSLCRHPIKEMQYTVTKKMQCTSDVDLQLLMRTIIYVGIYISLSLFFFLFFL